MNLMKTKFCPQRNSNCDPNDCIHYKNIGSIFIPSGYGGYDTELAETGVCRLWNDKEDPIEKDE